MAPGANQAIRADSGRALRKLWCLAGQRCLDGGRRRRCSIRPIPWYLFSPPRGQSTNAVGSREAIGGLPQALRVWKV